MNGETVPVQSWESECNDVIKDSAQVIDSLLRAAERHRKKGAGFFSFRAPCKSHVRKPIRLMSWFGSEKIDADFVPLDYAAFHQSMNGDVVRFFRRGQ